MPIHVICSGCLKRFQVGERFAGMSGPCPSCGTVIAIPMKSVKIHSDDDTNTEKRIKRRILSSPILRNDMEFDPVRIGQYALGVFSVLLGTFLIGCIPMYAILRSFCGILGLCLAAFPLSLFGYHFLRDREQIFEFAGKELYLRAGIAAAGYVILWLGFEYFLAATQSDVFFSCLYFAAFAVLATLLVHPVLELKTSDGFLHYCIFGVSIVVLRFFIGFGWFFESSGSSTAPILPGM
ncbi:MAG: hypothetical protein LBI05_05910 [Planctomycetaceae bacterium]|jgi:hypothetical protein|nr:hypothetical protein [Planctomycetaceae bacterium]